MADPEAQCQREGIKQRQEARGAALKVLHKATNDVRFPLGALRNVLRYARALMPSDVGTLRDALPALAKRIERVQAVAAEAPGLAWPEATELLRDAERMRDDATAALAEFDRRMEAQEAERRRRLGLPDESKAAR